MERPRTKAQYKKGQQLAEARSKKLPLPSNPQEVAHHLSFLLHKQTNKQTNLKNWNMNELEFWGDYK